MPSRLPFPLLLLVAVAAMLAAAPARAQRCAGALEVVLLAPDSVGMVYDASRVPERFYARRLVSTDGRFAVTVVPRRPDYQPPDEILRPALDGRSAFVARSGCGNDLRLVIARDRDAGGPDTMVVDAVNACDATVRLTLLYEPGRYDVLACDTIRYPAEGASADGWRYWPMAYAGAARDGRYEIAASLTRSDRVVPPEEVERRVIVRLVDRGGRPLRAPGADVRARVRGWPSILHSGGPRRHYRVPAYMDTAWPPPYWLRLRRLDDSGRYELHLRKGELPPNRSLELWVRAPGFVWWGPSAAHPLDRIDVVLDEGSSTELAPFNGSLLRFDYHRRLVVVPVGTHRHVDAEALRALPGVIDVSDPHMTRQFGRGRHLLLQLDRDLLPEHDPLLERLHRDSATALAGPAVRCDPDGLGITSSEAMMAALPRSFTLYSGNDSLVHALATRLGVTARSARPGERMWEIIAPEGSGLAVAGIARRFAVVRGIDSVELWVCPREALLDR